jgi:hypothetical protein
MKKTFLGAALLPLILLMLGFITHAQAESDLDFTIANKTGYDIKELYIGPTTSDEWGDNILKKTLKDGDSLEITFSPKAKAKKWDIKVVYEDKDKAQWIGYKLEEINKITLFWDAEKGKSTAKTE